MVGAQQTLFVYFAKVSPAPVNVSVDDARCVAAILTCTADFAAFSLGCIQFGLSLCLDNNCRLCARWAIDTNVGE